MFFKCLHLICGDILVLKMRDRILTRLINSILNIYGKIYKFGCPFIYSSDEFEYVNVPVNKNFILYYITWSFLYSDMHEDLFSRYLRFIGLKHDHPTFIMSLLHEVGHHRKGDIKNPSNMLNITQYKDKFNLKSKEELDLLIYYNIPDEYEASKWAVEFANEHEISLIILSYILYPLINRVYKHYWSLLIRESKIYTEK